MYVRAKIRPTPPVNYAGVTFSTNDPPNTECDKDTKIHKAQVRDIQSAPGTAEYDITKELDEDDGKDSCVSEDPAPSEDTSECLENKEHKGILSDALGEKFSLEDILLFGALFLLISGQIDDEILLLAGILLLFSN